MLFQLPFDRSGDTAESWTCRQRDYDRQNIIYSPLGPLNSLRNISLVEEQLVLLCVDRNLTLLSTGECLPPLGAPPRAEQHIEAVRLRFRPVQSPRARSLRTWPNPSTTCGRSSQPSPAPRACRRPGRSCRPWCLPGSSSPTPARIPGPRPGCPLPAAAGMLALLRMPSCPPKLQTRPCRIPR